MLTRRKFIGTAALCVADSFLLKNAYADDFRVIEEGYRPQYKYNPFAEAQNENLRIQGAIQNNILPIEGSDQRSFWDQPRKIFLKRKETGEQAHIMYFSNGQLNQQGYDIACYLLRDVKQNIKTNMDIKLLDLICAVQAWLNHYGIGSPIMIHSGYRTPQTNSKLEGAAKESMHLYGRAIDFSIPNLNPTMIAKIASQFKAGGIGIYPSRNFIHLDTGGIRLWVR